MVQRAVSRQVCRVCGGSCTSSLAMEEHIRDEHGTNWPIKGEGIVMAHRFKGPVRPPEKEQVSMAMFSARETPRPQGPEQQLEFVPHLMTTPWGRELR